MILKKKEKEPRLPIETVAAPSLGVPKAELERAWSNLG